MLSQKSARFAQKILKFNPLPSPQHNHANDSHEHSKCSHNHANDSHEHSKCSHNHANDSHEHSKCSHSPQQSIKPYLHVHDHRKEREIYQKPTKQKLECMRCFKQQGNEHFKSKRYQQASHYYNKLIIYADYTFPEGDKDQKQMEELVQQGNCNLGMSLLKLSQREKAEDSFGQSQREKAEDSFGQSAKGPNLKIVIKSVYWLAKCNLDKGDFTKAQKNIHQLKAFGENTKQQTKELEIQLSKAIETYQKKSKNIFGQMFSNHQNQ